MASSVQGNTKSKETSHINLRDILIHSTDESVLIKSRTGIQCNTVVEEKDTTFE